MESIQNLRRRIRGAQNIGQITKAMELVSATKMRKAQEIALDSRPYAYAALEILAKLSSLKDMEMPALFEKRQVERTVFILAASDKGLAGSFNGAVIRTFENFLKKENIDIHDPKYSFIGIGQKANQYLERHGARVIASFTRVGDFTKLQEIEPIVDLLINGFLSHDFDKATAFFTTFVSALRQDVVIRELLPVSPENIKESLESTLPRSGRFSQYIDIEAFSENGTTDYIIEPSPKELLDELAPQLLKIRMYHLLMEANASEHSARRMAMKNASDNANDLSQRLNIEYNKSRQAAITNQIIEVTSGAQTAS